MPGATLQQVARNPGINANMLGRWRRAIERHDENAFPGQGHARDKEVMRLKRQLARVKKERVSRCLPALGDAFHVSDSSLVVVEICLREFEHL
jgi:transposase-like protein